MDLNCFRNEHCAEPNSVELCSTNLSKNDWSECESKINAQKKSFNFFFLFFFSSSSKMSKYIFRCKCCCVNADLSLRNAKKITLFTSLLDGASEFESCLWYMTGQRNLNLKGVKFVGQNLFFSNSFRISFAGNSHAKKLIIWN